MRRIQRIDAFDRIVSTGRSEVIDGVRVDARTARAVQVTLARLRPSQRKELLRKDDTVRRLIAASSRALPAKSRASRVVIGAGVVTAIVGVAAIVAVAERRAEARQ